MAEWKSYLTDQELKALREAAINGGLVTSSRLEALKSTLDPLFAASLFDVGAPIDVMMIQLTKMNRVHNLRNGDVPLAQWLDAAITLLGNRPEATVCEETLSKVSNRMAAPPAQVAGAAVLATANLDVTPEAQVTGMDVTADVGFLFQGVTAASSVVKVVVHKHLDGHPVFQPGQDPWLVNGTGWLIAPQLVITNHHVINARMQFPIVEPDASNDDFRLQAEHSTVIYDYLKAGTSSPTVQTGAGALEASDKSLDFAILRIKNPPDARKALRLRTQPIRKRPEQALGTRVNLLQHPNGNPMRLGFRDNFVVVGGDDTLSYLTGTDLGSSGSPVCDDTWMVAALHSGSQKIAAGVDINIRGQKITRENYGIPIPKILKHLQAQHPALHAEILAGQAPPA